MDNKIKIENNIKPSDKEMEAVADSYAKFYQYRNARDSITQQFQNMPFEDMLETSRVLFWNSLKTESEDLSALGLDFSFPFVRKEVIEFVGRIAKLNVSPKMYSNSHHAMGVKVLQAIYKKYRIKGQDRVEKFWQILYGVVNGTVCLFVHWDGSEEERRFLEKYDSQTGAYTILKKKVKPWNDVRVEIVPIEEMYLANVTQRDIKKQTRSIRKKTHTGEEFQALYGHYGRAEHVVAGNRIDQDSLYYRLLEGTGVLGQDRIQVMYDMDTANDKLILSANGVVLNFLGEGSTFEVSPNPFHHKEQPYVWSIFDPIDEKLAYGLPMPMKLRSQSNILNTSFAMMIEAELRAVDPPFLTSDFMRPDLVFGDKKVVPVGDVNAWKQLDVREPSSSYFTMMNSVQGLMSSFAQGGGSQAAPSKQPKAAREIIAMENMKQEALGATLVMYYHLVFNELFLILKTALQFYSSEKFTDQKDGIVRSLTVPEFPLTKGGLGNVEVRFVTGKSNPMKLYFDAINKSIENGSKTEIIEVAKDAIINMEWFIEEVKLESEKATELERAAYFEQVLTPMLEIFVPAGIASIEKTYLRFLEKMGESPSDYTSDEVLPQIYSTMQNKLSFNPEALKPGGSGTLNGDLKQSTTGTINGEKSNGGFGAEMALPGQQ